MISAFAFLAAPVLATPISQDDAAPQVEPVSSATLSAPDAPRPLEVGRSSARVASDVRQRPGPNRTAGTGAPAGADAGLAVRATIAARRGEAAPVDENPSVDVLDVVDSVLGSAIGSAPWLHIGSHRPLERALRVEGGSTGDAAPEATNRIDYSVYADGARAATPGDTDAPRALGGSQSNPIRDAVQVVRDLIAHPITWVIGALALLGSLTMAVVRGRSK